MSQKPTSFKDFHSHRLPLIGWHSTRDLIANKLAKESPWIEAELGCAIEDSLFIAFDPRGDDHNTIGYAIYARYTGHSQEKHERSWTKSAHALAQAIDLPKLSPGTLLEANLYSQMRGGTVVSMTLEHNVLQGSASFYVPTIGVTCVYTQFDFVSGPDAGSSQKNYCLFIHRKNADKALTFFKDIYNADSGGNSRLYTVDGSQGSSDWSDAEIRDASSEGLVYDESVIELVKNDVEAFYKREDWFKKHHLPFRRGYLLHGPPGNGKTSMIRSLVNKLGINAYTIRLLSQKLDDKILEELFERAFEDSPSFILFEDLDRAFPKATERKSNVSLQSLLNCMDGVATQNGVITIATANEPTALDKSILKRPGRFDRTVLFDNPNAALRQKYFALKNAELLEDELAQVAVVTDGFSFAQLQETYIMAGQRAYQNGSETVNFDDLVYGAHTLRENTNLTEKKAIKAGFGV